MNSSEIMDLLGSVGDGPYVKNVDIVIVIETSENMSRVVDDIKNLDFSVDGFLNYLGLRDRENIKMEILRHTIFSLIMLGLLCISAIVETFISTNLLKNFLKYF